MEVLDSRGDKFKKRLKRGGPGISSISIKARGPKKGRSRDSHDQVSFQENHPCVARCQREEDTQMCRTIFGLEIKTVAGSMETKETKEEPPKKQGG